MSEIVMKLDSVGVSYHGLLPFRKRHSALTDISFDVRKGETLGIIGRNGAGKSTLMKVMARIVNPDTGSVGGTAQKVQLLSLQVGFIPELSGRENAILSALLFGLNKKDIIKKLPEIIEFSGLGDAIYDPLNTYSSGMRARLGFAVSCQTDPDLLLIDEALGVGDKDFKEKSRNVILQRMKSDRSFVIVSHNEGTILEHCKRAVWIEGGRVMMVDDADLVINAYKSST
jgi:lipopolysaccharide transport system ATP-binding protein